MNVTEAIRQLRPQFAERERLRESFQQLRETYINTIPQDIIDIIFGMIPLLQVGPESIQMEHEKFIEFSDKYQIIEDGVRKIKNDNEPCVSRINLIRDFPEHTLMLAERRADIKWIGDKLYIVGPENTHYAGQKYFIRDHYRGRATLINFVDSPTCKQTNYSDICIHRVLPCGLAIGTLVAGDRNQYLMDFDNEQYILLDLPDGWTGTPTIINMMDDYGKIHKYPNTETIIAGVLGKQFGRFLTILLE